MKKINFPILLSALWLSALPLTAADTSKPAYDYLAVLADQPVLDVAVPAPAPESAAEETKGYENPPCVPSKELLPGKGFAPVVSDERRLRAIEDLLAKIAVCKPMPYDNDGNVHSKPHPGLPAKPAGYYLEYTLIVPGRPTGSGPEPVVIGGNTYMAGPVQTFRGAERIMIGNHREVFYTPDHYKTFIRLSIAR